ncbi:MAG: hypothetical protein AAGK09_00735 [Planctomycetota bacterium]
MPPAEARPSRTSLAATTIAVLASAAITGLLIGLVENGGRAQYDQDVYHLVAIATFAEQWPTPDLRDYPSATSPGYHLLLSLPYRLGLDGTTALRCLAWSFTALLIGTLAGWLTRQRGPAAALLVAPLLGSLYVSSAGAWLLPDDAAWWLVAAVLILAMRPAWRGSTPWLAGAALLGLVLVRQNHLWAALPMVVAGWSWSRGEADKGWLPTRGWSRPIAMALACGPAVLAVGGLVALWGGLTPPSFQLHVDGPNPAVPATILALLGVFGVFYLGWLTLDPDADRYADQDAGPKRRLLPTPLEWAGGLGALVIAAAPATSFDADAGRWSGIYNLVRMLPTVAERSPLMIVLATVGGLALARWLRLLPRHERWVLGSAMLGFGLAMSSSGLAWQRYYEPMLLIWLALAAARSPRPGRVAWVGPVMLALLLGGVTIATYT